MERTLEIVTEAVLCAAMIMIIIIISKNQLQIKPGNTCSHSLIGK